MDYSILQDTTLIEVTVGSNAVPYNAYAHRPTHRNLEHQFEERETCARVGPTGHSAHDPADSTVIAEKVIGFCRVTGYKTETTVSRL